MKTVLLLITAFPMLVLSDMRASAANTAPSELQSILTDLDRRSSASYPSPADTSADVARLTDALNNDHDDPFRVAAMWRLADIYASVDRHADAESVYRNIALDNKAAISLKLQSLLNAYEQAVAAGQDPTSVDHYLINYATIYVRSHGTLDKLDIDAAERNFLLLNVKRAKCYITYGTMVSNGKAVATQPSNLAAVIATAYEKAYLAFGRAVDDLGGEAAERQRDWLQKMNFDRDSVSMRQADTALKLVELGGDGDASWKSKYEEAAQNALERVVTQYPKSVFLQHAASMLLAVESRGTKPLTDEKIDSLVNAVSNNPGYEILSTLRSVGVQYAQSDDESHKNAAEKLLKIDMDLCAKWYPKECADLIDFQWAALARARLAIGRHDARSARALLNAVPNPKGSYLESTRVDLMKDYAALWGNADERIDKSLDKLDDLGAK